MACTTDSASNNDTMMAAIEDTCRNKIIDFTKDKNHVRCLAHVINLAVQDALRALKAENVKDNGIDDNDVINDVIPKVRIMYLLVCKIQITHTSYSFVSLLSKYADRHNVGKNLFANAKSLIFCVKNSYSM